jgi:hypothetical protein
LIRTLAWGWFAALALSSVWFLVEPLLFHAPPPWLRWTVLGVAVAVGTAAAAAIAVKRRATAVQAALALDEQFRLKERVTTSLLLRPDEAASPAGAALLADADQRVRPLRVGERFPVRIPWTAALAPAAAVVLFFLIYFYHPDFSKAQAAALTAAQRAEAMKAEIDPVQQQLQKKNEARKKGPPKSEELKKIEADIDKMVNNRHDTPEQVREDVKKGDDIENDLKKQDKAAADAARALKDRLDELERAARAKREADALAQKMDAAQQAKDLRQKIDDEKDPQKKQELQDQLKKQEDAGLKADDPKKLDDQLKDLKNDADQLTRKNEEDQKKADDDLKKLDDDAKKDGADKDQLQKEKDQLDKEKDQLKQQQQALKDASQKLDQAQQAMQQGKEGDAARQLKDAGDKMSQLSKDADVQQAAKDAQAKEDERNRIADDMKQVQDMKQALAKGLAKQDNQGQPGDRGGDQGKPGDQAAQGPNPQGLPGTGAGDRPESADAQTGEKDTQIHSNPDDKALQQVIGDMDAPHDRFTGPKKPDDMQEDIRRAAQEGESASERERLTDKGAADMAGQFFKKMRPPDKPDEKKPAPPK